LYGRVSIFSKIIFLNYRNAPSITDITSLFDAFYNNKTYDYMVGKKKYTPVGNGWIKEYERMADGRYELIRSYKPAKGGLATFNNGVAKYFQRLNFIKQLASALNVAGFSIDLIQDYLQREEKTGKPLTNREWAAVIISSVGLNVASTILSGLIGAMVASIIAPEAPVANAIIGGLVGTAFGYLGTLFTNKYELQDKTEEQLVKIFDQLFG
jgi:hypothetical protein